MHYAAISSSPMRGACGAGTSTSSALEVASFRGQFDHRREGPSHGAGRARFAESLRRLEQPGVADGAVVHVGHSTHLVAVAGARLLTDPWFYDPAFGALSHLAGPAVPPEETGRLDAVLVSHDHADHLDPRAADRLDKRAVAVVATSALAARMRALGFAGATVLAPWETLEVAGARVTAVPGEHDIYEIGFVVQGAGRAVYFAGDTRLFDGLCRIAERLAPTFAILPVDGTRLTGAPLHVMTPGDAVEAARTLGVRAAMPSHAEAAFCDPIAAHVLASTVEGAPAKFAAAMGTDLPHVACHVPAPGELVPVEGG
jgi:L-ascorbate metabolism protein UlaG (beta-lactamase superfamily)